MIKKRGSGSLVSAKSKSGLTQKKRFLKVSQTLETIKTENFKK